MQTRQVREVQTIETRNEWAKIEALKGHDFSRTSFRSTSEVLKGHDFSRAIRPSEELPGFSP
jgi:hypothetical protein